MFCIVLKRHLFLIGLEFLGDCFEYEMAAVRHKKYFVFEKGLEKETGISRQVTGLR